MIPKKYSEIIKPVADEFEVNEQLVTHIVEAYWKDVRKNLVNCEANNIIVSGLGTFIAKPWKVPQLINSYQGIVDKYKSIIESGNKISFQKFAFMKEHQERIEVLKNLLNMINEDKNKKILKKVEKNAK